jgi:hypothetical protein
MDMIERLLAEAAQADWIRRLDLASDFTAWWHGPIARRSSSLQLAECPDPLRAFHERLGEAPFVLSGQNRFLFPPEPLDDRSRILFYRENQGVYYWGTEARAEDPPVYGAWDIAGPWSREEPTLSAFLLQAMLFETVLGAECAVAAAWVPSDRLPDLLETLQPVPLGSWPWPSYPTRFYAGGDVLLVASPNDDCFSVWAAPRRASVPRPRGFDCVEWDSLNWDDAAG